jgi:hypothetical protein
VFTVAFLIYEFFTWLPYTWLVGGIIGIFVLWVVGKRAHHMSKIRNPLDKELTQASHGAALVFLTPLFTHTAFLNRWVDLLPHDWLLFVWPATLALMGLGAFWLILGWHRSRTNFRDALLIGRALVKIAVGGALGGMLYQHILPPHDWPYRFYLYLALLFVALWCCLTGFVKFVLLLRGPPGSPQADKGTQPYGGAGFAE